MKFPLGRKGFVALGAVAGGLAFWRARQRRRQQEELEWEAEVASAIDEGRSAGEQRISSSGTTDAGS
jgi:hypothetical protein